MSDTLPIKVKGDGTCLLNRYGEINGGVRFIGTGFELERKTRFAKNFPEKPVAHHGWVTNFFEILTPFHNFTALLFLALFAT